MATFRVAPLLAVLNRTYKQVWRALAGVTELRNAAAVEDMATGQRPYSIIAAAVKQERSAASCTKRRRIRQGHHGIIVTSRHGLNVDSRLNEAVRETWRRRPRMRPGGVKVF